MIPEWRSVPISSYYYEIIHFKSLPNTFCKFSYFLVIQLSWQPFCFICVTYVVKYNQETKYYCVFRRVH